MSQLPRDPRQLARDILSGKVKLEDLAREKARQQQMPGGIAPTARVPSPRPMPPPQQPVPTAPARPPAFPQRPPERRPMSPPPPPPPPRQPIQQRPVQQRPAPQRRQQMPPAIPQRPVRAVTQSMQARTQAADQQLAQNLAQARKVEAARPVPTPSGRLAIRQMLGNRQSIRTGILLSEILGPPKALRDEI